MASVICSISEEEVNDLLSVVYGDFYDAYKAGTPLSVNGEPVSIESYMRNFVAENFRSVLDNDLEVEAFTQILPGIMAQAATIKNDVMQHLFATNFDIGAVAKLSNEFKDHAKVQEFLGTGVKAAEDAEEAAEEGLKKSKKGNTLIVQKEEIINQFSYITDSMYSTTGLQNLIDSSTKLEDHLPDPKKDFYYNFLKFALDNASSDNKFSYSITAVPIKAIKDMDPTGSKKYIYTPKVADLKQLRGDLLVLAVTDTFGNILLFDNEYKITDKGKPIYFQSRSGKRAKEGKGPLLLRPDQIAKRQGITVDQAQKIQDDQIQFMINLEQYTKANISKSENWITFPISGVSLGAFYIDYNVLTNLNEVQNFTRTPFVPYILSQKNEDLGVESYAVFELPGITGQIPIIARGMSEDIAQKFAKLLVNPIYKKNPLGKTRELNYKEKSDLFNIYFYDQETGIALTSKAISVDGKKLDLTNPEEAAKALYEHLYVNHYLSGVKVSKKEIENGFLDGVTIVPYDKEGAYKSKLGPKTVVAKGSKEKPTYYKVYKRRLNIDKKTLSDPERQFNDFKIVEEGDKLMLQDNIVDYADFIKNNFYINFPLNKNKELVGLNGYIKFAPSAETLSKMLSYKKEDPKEKAAKKTETKKKAEEVKNKVISKLATPNSKDLVKNILKNNKFRGLSKNKKQAAQFVEQYGINFELTQMTPEEVEQKLADAETWFDDSVFSKHFKFIELFDYVNTSDPDTIASLTEDAITLWAGSDYSDLYHESWHGFTQFFLNEAERKSLYDKTRKRTGNFRTYKGVYRDFAKASDLELEEFLAEEFRAYMLSDGKMKIEDRTQSNIFKRIFNFLLDLFGFADLQSFDANQDALTYVNELYTNLKMGDLKNYTFSRENAPADFKALNKGMEATNTDEAIPTLSTRSSLALVDTIDSLASDFVNTMVAAVDDEGNISGENTYFTTSMVTTIEGKEAMFDYIKEKIDERIELYDEIISEMQDEEDADRQIQSLLNIQDTLNWALRNWDSKDDKGVLDYYYRKSKFIEFGKRYDKVVTLFEDIEDPNFKKGREGYDRKGNEASLTELANEKVIYLIRSLHGINPDGSEVLNSLGFNSLMDFPMAWNRLAKTLDGANSVQEMYRRLDSSKEDYPFFQELLLKLGNPDTQMDAYSQSMWTSFLQAFGLSRVPLIAMVVDQSDIKEKDEDGKVSVVDVEFSAVVGGASVADKKVGRDWSDHFKTTTSRFIKQDVEGNNYLDVPELLSKYPNGVSKTDRWEFFKDIGLNFSNKDKIRQELNSLRHNPAITFFNRIIDLYNAYEEGRVEKPIIIRDIKDIVAERDYKNFDVVSLATDYNTLQSIEAKHSDDYSDFMVLNAAGDAQYEFMLNSTLTQMIKELNDAPSYNELISNPEMNHLSSDRNPWASINPKSNRKRLVTLYDMFDMAAPGGPKRALNPEYGSTEKVSIDINNMAGVSFTINGISNTGITAADADEVTKRLSDFHVSTLYGLPMGTTPADKSTILMYHLSNRKYYVNPKYFVSKEYSDRGNLDAYQIMLGYLEGELDRIYQVSNLDANSPEALVPVGKKKYGETGKEFVIFADMLSKPTKDALMAIPDEYKQNLRDYLDTEEGATLNRDIYRDIMKKYFPAKVAEFDSRLREAEYIDNNIHRKIRDLAGNRRLSKADTREAAVKAHVINSFIHNVETVLLYHGDPALYNMVKEDFQKRNAGINSTGTFPRIDSAMLNYINNVAFGKDTRGKDKVRYSNSSWYTGQPVKKVFTNQMRSAVLQDVDTQSLYLNILKEKLRESLLTSPAYKNKKLSASQINDIIDKKLEPYTEMKEGDGQGWITFDAYKALSIELDSWSDQQEVLYRKILNREYVSPSAIIEFFPVLKMQYWGPLANKGLPLTAFHKFSIAPLVPSTIENTDLEVLQNKLVEQGFEYALFSSGSKVSTITPDGVPDKFYKDASDAKNRDLAITEEDYKFTPNDIFLKYFKKQVEIAPTYKGKVIFSTQLRKLIETGLMEMGIPVDFKPEESYDQRKAKWNKVKAKWNSLSESQKLKTSNNYTKLVNFEKSLDKLMEKKKQDLLDEMGWSYDDKGVPTGPLDKLFNFIERQLTKQDIADHQLDFLQVTKSGKLKHSLDISLAAAQIEKVLISIVNKRLIKQKVLGEALIQVSGAGYTNREFFNENKDAPLETRLKVLGTNDLPFYTPGKAAKVKIALQGKFLNLLRLPEVNAMVRENLDKGEPLTHLQALNKLIKTDEWLNEGDNRAMVSMAAVRIPVQGLNSMEAFEVYEFLPEGGNQIILPAEIVAKSGGDFDIDKLTSFMPDIEVNENGDVVLKDTPENEVLRNMTDIITMPENFVDLITPNATDILSPLAKELASKVRPYDPLQNVFGERGDNISGTRIFEIEYNIYKHGSNNIGKKTLGQGAVDNTYNVIFNTVGAYLEPEYLAGNRTKFKRRQEIYLNHNTLDVNDEKAISLSNIYDADGVNKISEVISQLINGWVDIARDPWIFDIQGNNFVAPSLLLMIQAGVPIADAVYFASQPIVREYISQQKKARSAFANALGINLDNPNFYRSEARKTMLKNFPQTEELFSVNKKTGEEYIKPESMYTGMTEFAEPKRDEIFNLEYFKDNVTTPVSYNENELALLLHFMDIEDMSKVITSVKRTTNFDTATSSSLFQNAQRSANAEILASDGRMGKDIVSKILNESSISSFVVTDFMRDVYKNLFSVRDSKTMNDFILGKLARGINKDVEDTFDDIDMFVSQFRNDTLMFMFQNYVRNLDLDSVKTYKSAVVDSYAMSVRPTIESPIGVFVKEGVVKRKIKGVSKDVLRPVVYVDRARLAEEYGNLQSGQDLFTEDMPIAPVKKKMFQNIREYARFVMEREYLRFVLKPENVVTDSKFVEYANQFAEEGAYENESEQDFEDRVSVDAYEHTLRDMAFENTFNHYYMFKSKKNYAQRLADIKKTYPELEEAFPVLKFLSYDKSKKGEYIIKFRTSKIDVDRVNKFYEDITDLSNASTLHGILANVPSNEVNDIAKFFENLPMYTMFTTGFATKGEYAIAQIMPNKRLTGVLTNMLNYFDKEKLMTWDLFNNYFKKFVNVNGFKNSANRYKIKNYTLDQPLWKASKNKKAELFGEYGNISTGRDNFGKPVYSSTFEESNKLLEDITTLLNNRSNYAFIFNGATKALGIPKSGSDGVLADPNLGASNVFGIAAAKTYQKVPSARMTDDTYDDNVEVIEKSLNDLEDYLKSEKLKPFWNSYGYGQYMIGADQYGENIDATKARAPKTFVYLSKRLYEKFGYVNPNYNITKEGRSFVKVSTKDVIQKIKECLK
jgi:hypothetical protein